MIVQYINLPGLTDRLRAHFNCSTLEGAYLENQGASFSIGSHFERRIFFNELMTGSTIRDTRFSEFTLAFLEETGWYQVDYKYAEPMTYGKDKGCDFLNQLCVNQTTLEPRSKEFCGKLTAIGNYWTRRGVGVCGASSIMTDASLSQGFDYWGNKTTVIDQYADNCPTVQMYKNIDCEDSNLQSTALLSEYEHYGYGAKGFIGTLYRNGDHFSNNFGYCFLPKVRYY